VKLTTHLHLVSRLRMNGTTSFFFLFLHMVKCELTKFCCILYILTTDVSEDQTLNLLTPSIQTNATEINVAVSNWQYLSLLCLLHASPIHTFLFSDHINIQARSVQSFSQKATNVIQSWFMCNMFKTHSNWYKKCLTYCIIVIVFT
jgi:hypothetical protein